MNATLRDNTGWQIASFFLLAMVLIGLVGYLSRPRGELSERVGPPTSAVRR